ncbi:MAG: hypothetical protein J5W83_09905 [Candidatus Accumulibacter sp.]|uniref:hypothetical protein n=1 Tax=Accumulibacter sp. TaxID=2053492 RepID=UPI001B1CD158|nr:hypothetical protein [Accumulibacter sp.]MBO3702841.1 hypothetical protein [Accumulibacter sp.]
MHYELRLSSPSLDVLPLVAIAGAVAGAAATGGDTPFHEATYKGKFRKLQDWVVDDARAGRLAVTDQDGRPGTFDEVVQRAKNDGTYSEVFELSEEILQKIADGEPFSDALQDPASRKFDLNATHALCVYTTLKNLNDWASAQGNTFSISRVGWIDERGWIEPSDTATENPLTTDTRLTVSGRGQHQIKPVYSGARSTSVVVFICGREAIPVRAIPLVTGRWMSPDVVAKSLAHADSINSFDGVFAYQLLADGGYLQVLPGEWDVVKDHLEGLEIRLNAMSDDSKRTRPIWLTESTKLLPTGVFLWRDEFERAFRRRYSPWRFSLLDARPGDLTLKFSPLISPPETRAIVMEGFEGLPLAATSPPIVGEEPERARHDEEHDSAWDELESSSYYEQMGQVVLASLYPRGRRAVNISDERCLELARSTCLQVADWIELTGVRLGEHEHYLVEQSSVRFVKWSDEAITDAPTGWQPAMLRDNRTLPLPFPCTPEQLLQFVDTLRVGVHAFGVPDVFRQAVVEIPETSDDSPVLAEQPALSDNGRSGAPTLVSVGESKQADAPEAIERKKAHRPRITQMRAILQSFIDSGVNPTIESIWVHIGKNAGKDNFEFSSRSVDIAVHVNGKRMKKTSFERCLQGMLKTSVPKHRND